MVTHLLDARNRRSHPLELPTLSAPALIANGGVDPVTGLAADRWVAPTRSSDVLFTPNENAYDYEVRCLDEVIAARRADPNRYSAADNPYRVLYAVYNLRNQRVFNKLVEAQRLGVDMQVLIEADQIAPDRPHNKLGQWFREAGLKVITSDRERPAEADLASAHLIGIDQGAALMHMKSRIYRWKDPQTGEAKTKLLMGPLNPGGDPVKNDEHLNVFTDPKLVDLFTARYYEVRAHEPAKNAWNDESPINVLFTPHTPESITPAKKLFDWIDSENELIVMSIFCLRNLTTKGDRETMIEKLARAQQRGAKVLVLTDMRKSDGKTFVFDEHGVPKKDEHGKPILVGVEMYGEEAGDENTDEKLQAAGIRVLEFVNAASEHSAMHERFTVFGLTDMRVLSSEGNYTVAAMGSARSNPKNQESYAFIDSGRYDHNYTGRAFLARALQLVRKYDRQFEESAEDVIRELQAHPAWPKLKLDPLSLIETDPNERIDLLLDEPVNRTVPLPSADRPGSLRSRRQRRLLDLPFGSILSYRTKDAATGEIGPMHRILMVDAPDHPAPEL
jgi:hypothetical protein